MKMAALHFILVALCAAVQAENATGNVTPNATGNAIGNGTEWISDSEIKSNTVLYSEPITISKREYADSKYNQQEKDDIVAKHNLYRRNEPASDMQLMRWDESLAKMAQEWAQECKWEHGNPDNISPWKSVGQNLYLTTGSVQDATRPTVVWVEKEIGAYDYDTKKCSKVCGHYTQVVWAGTTHVGCGAYKCSKNDGGDITSGEIVVCNYGPPGNYRGVRPYKKGDSCRACKNEKFWCKDGLCDDCEGESDCTCEVKCYNCATVDEEGCSCSCPSGWRGATCQDKCEDTHRYCGANPGWPKFWCNQGRSYVDNNCFAFCGYCDANPDAATCDPDEMCSGVVCQNGGTARASGNECACVCPFGFGGSDCSNSDSTEESSEEEESADPCDSVTCNNGGTAEESEDSSSCSCSCTDDFTGDDCSEPVAGPCESVTCNNGGTPTESADGSSCACECTVNWTGDDCSDSVDPCSSVRCYRGGTAVPSSDGTTCKCRCTAKWQGYNCKERKPNGKNFWKMHMKMTQGNSATHEKAKFTITMNLYAKMSDWEGIWEVLAPLVAESITSTCNTANWYMSCCRDSSSTGLSFDPALPYMTTDMVSVNDEFPKASRGKLLVQLTAQAETGSQLCEAGSYSKRGLQDMPLSEERFEREVDVPISGEHLDKIEEALENLGL